MASVFDYQFNVGGNFTAAMDGMAESTGRFNAAVESSARGLSAWEQKFAAFGLISDYIDRASRSLQEFSDGGVSLDSQMHDLSAVAGVTGKGLKEIEGYARASAKTFGTDASVAVEGYKLLLSQLSPELGKYPEALQKMGNSIQTTSKLMANDGTAAAEVLTTAMNQYGVSLDDPMRASEEMARMMNVMAAAGQEGSAELPAIKVALEQCGMAAKAANVSFEETNAAIQVLDKAGKKGSEGGVALRNTLAILGQGRFLPKDTREALEIAGIDVLKLSDTSMSLKDRLEMLKPVLNDAALFSKLFGMENANAARALVQGTDELGRLTQAITGTSSAEEQAAIVMDGYAERQARIKQHIENTKISLFQLTGDFTLWAGVIGETLVPLAQLTPLFQAAWSGMVAIKNLQWAAMWSRTQGFIYAARLQMAFMNRELIMGQFVSNGFIVNIIRATLAVLRFATVGLFQAIKGLGALIVSFVTGGTASATFAGIASTSFGIFKASAVTACRAVSTAIMNVPLIGWIIAIIAGFIALGVYFWKTSATFRAALKGIGAAFVATFRNIWQLAVNVFGGIADLIKAAFSLDAAGIKSALSRLKGGFTEFGTNVGKAFNDAYSGEMARAMKDKEKRSKENNTDSFQYIDYASNNTGINNPVSDPTAGTLGSVSNVSSADGGKIKNVVINIEKLVERFEIHTTNLKSDLGQVRDLVAEALLSAVNDVNLSVE